MMLLSQERRVWRVAVGSASSPISIVRILLLVAAVIGGAVGTFVWKDPVHGILRGAGNPLSVLAFSYWALFMSGAATQNKPANACLVPGLTRSVRRATVMTWMMTMAPVACISFVHPQGWMVLLSGSVFVTAFGLYRAGCERFAIVAALAAAAYFWMPAHPLLGDSVLAFACAASLLFAAWALQRALPQGGDRHFAMLEKRARAQALDTMDSTTQSARSDGKRRRVYGMFLRRDVSARDSDKLLMHVLGPNNYSVLFVEACAGVGLLAATGAMHLLGMWPEVEELARLLGISLLAGLGFSWYRFAAGILAAGSEQALVRMAPGMPSAARLNRALGKRILRTCALEWLGAAMLVGGAFVLWNIPAFGFMIAAAFSLAILPLVSLSLGDYSGKSSYRYDGVVVSTLMCLITAFVSVFWVDSVTVWLALMASILALSLACIGMRWSAMMAAPPAFPALRMA